MSTTLREQIDTYVKRVKDLSEHVRGNEQATKQSLIGPFFTMLGYDLTDPRECIPEYRADFGKERSSKPIDWAFLNGTTFAFFVEAAPFDVITLLQKSQFNPELIRAYAQRKRAQNLLVGELSRLLEPAAEFTKLAIANLETRNLTQAVTESWKPVVAAALNEWARQRMLATVLAAPSPAQETKAEKAEPKIETTAEELAAFEVIRGIIGPENPIAYEDSVAYFKIHLAGRRTWVFARLQFGKKQTSVWVPLPVERATPLAGGKPVGVQSGWSVVNLEPNNRIDDLADLFRAAYQHVKRSRSGDPAEE